MANIHYVNPKGYGSAFSFRSGTTYRKAKYELYSLYRNCSLAVLNSEARSIR